MRGAASTMEVLRPASAAEAVALYARRPDALVLAGGTDLMVHWNMGALNGRTVIDLSLARELRPIRVSTEAARFGATATHAEIQEHPVVAKRLPLLAQACATIGAAQIQNRGTLGGNVANASPAGDTFPPLAVYDTTVHLLSSRGRRSLPFLEVFAGVKRTNLAPGELISSIEVAWPEKPARQLFRKVGTRAAQAISKVAAAGLLWLEKGKVRELRFALGSVAPTVRRLRTVESFLREKRLTPAVIEEAAGLVEMDISPIDDLRSTRAYRLQVSRNLLRSFLS